MAESSSIIEGTVKFRDGKKWKSRWCVMRKLSPVADCVHLQLYKDSKDRQKNGQTKASLSLQKFLGFESGFTLDKESNTIAILCEDVVPVLAFDTREILIQWRVKVSHNLGASREFSAMCMSAPARGPLRAGPLRLHARAARLAAASGAPPALLAVWEVAHLRRFGMVEGRFCMEGGSRCGRAGGAFVFGVERGRDLVQLLDAAATAGSGHAGSRLSLASRSGSIIDKRLSDASSCADDACCHTSLRSVSPTWHAATSAADHNTTDLDSSACSDAPVRPNSLLRCSSCIGKFGGARSAATTPGAMSALSPAWIMDSVSEKRSDCDRVSIYSRSSGSMSEYSVPRSIGASANHLDKSFERASPITCCTPTVPLKTGLTCQCWQQQTKTCSCNRKKLFSGPYENYDIPKTPMPLIHEHPADSQNTSDASSYYDTPKKLLKCLAETTSECKCQTDECNLETDESKRNSCISSQLGNGDESFSIESHSNYVNMDPMKEPIEKTEDYGNYVNVDLSVTLEQFETSSQILRSAGFSQEEIDALDDVRENKDGESDIYIPNDSSNIHENYVHMEPLRQLSDENRNNQFSDTLSHISEPSSKTYEDLSSTIRRRSSSADFMKRAEDFIDIYKSNSHRDVTINLNGLRKSVKNECINDKCDHCIRTYTCSGEDSNEKSEFKVPEIKNDSSFLAKFRDSVKIRRSSSVPSKTEKNRDSSSSNDSGVSTGSLKHHRCDFSEFELPITNSKSCKKHIKSSNKSCRKTHKAHNAHSAHSMFVKSNSSDPLKNITFQFDEVATLTKAMSCDVDTLTRRQKPRGCASLDGSHARDSQITTRSSQSTSSGASDMSDYLESLSLSSFSSCDVTASHNHPTHRSVLRPRSGNQYLTMDRVRSCTNNPNN